tara:strand:+ start:5533 stop:5919 length:387 start_codon:yes stop_codon:yes gene_type:complete
MGAGIGSALKKGASSGLLGQGGIGQGVIGGIGKMMQGDSLADSFSTVTQGFGNLTEMPGQILSGDFRGALRNYADYGRFKQGSTGSSLDNLFTDYETQQKEEEERRMWEERARQRLERFPTGGGGYTA